MKSRFREFERKFLRWWMQSSLKYQDSYWPPILLFLIITADGILTIIPSLACLAAMITMAPRRWLLFAAIAFASNTFVGISAYFIGLMAPDTSVTGFVQSMGLELFWNKAADALNHYGAFGILFVAMLGLPSQMAMAILGISDAHESQLGFQLTSTFWKSAALCVLGLGVKNFGMSWLILKGWLKLEHKIETHVITYEKREGLSPTLLPEGVIKKKQADPIPPMND